VQVNDHLRPLSQHRAAVRTQQHAARFELREIFADGDLANAVALGEFLDLDLAIDQQDALDVPLALG